MLNDKQIDPFKSENEATKTVKIIKLNFFSLKTHKLGAVKHSRFNFKF